MTNLEKQRALAAAAASGAPPQGLPPKRTKKKGGPINKKRLAMMTEYLNQKHKK